MLYSLNPCCTFGSFSVDSSNEFAFNILKSVKTKAGIHNPICIYGPCGSGKTHLLHAVGNMYGGNVVYATTIQFMYDCYTKKTEFLKKYLKSDILLIDDIQYLHNKPHTQEKLFFILDYLCAKGKQVVFTSLDSPLKIDVFTQLKSRFERGLIVDIDYLEENNKRWIIKEWNSISDEDLDFILKRVDGSIGKLESVVNAILLHSKITNAELNRDYLKKRLNKIVL